MKTTINIDKELITKAMEITGTRTMTETIELGLREIINSRKRKELAGLFGQEKQVKIPRRRRKV